MHSRVHLIASFLIPGHTYLLLSERAVVRPLGCESPCTVSKAVRRKLTGMNGLTMEFAVSQCNF